MTVLQVYSGDADAVSMLDELEFCYSKFLGDESKKKRDTSDASDALVEILLSFASKQSQLFRRMSEQVFGAFADQVTENGLESLISVCTPVVFFGGIQLIVVRFWKPRRAWLVSRRCSMTKTTTTMWKKKTEMKMKMKMRK